MLSGLSCISASSAASSRLGGFKNAQDLGKEKWLKDKGSVGQEELEGAFDPNTLYTCSQTIKRFKK